MEFRTNSTGGEYLHAAMQQVSDSFETVGESFRLVGVDMFQAMNEVAYEIGGDNFADEVVEVAFNDYDVLPNPAALRLLVERNPNAAIEVMVRSSEIQKQRHQEELDTRFPIQSRLRKIGKGILDANTLLWTGQRPK